jgi:hypothetical protein
MVPFGSETGIWGQYRGYCPFLTLAVLTRFRRVRICLLAHVRDPSHGSGVARRPETDTADGSLVRQQEYEHDAVVGGRMNNGIGQLDKNPQYGVTGSIGKATAVIGAGVILTGLLSTLLAL